MEMFDGRSMIAVFTINGKPITGHAQTLPSLSLMKMTVERGSPSSSHCYVKVGGPVHMPDRIREGVGVIGAEIACVPVGGFRADGGSSTLQSCNASGIPTIRKPNTLFFYCTQWWIQELGGGGKIVGGAAPGRVASGSGAPPQKPTLFA